MFFGPKNSLVLSYDLYRPEALDSLEAEWNEVRKYYKFVPLSEIIKNLGSRQSLGKAAVVLETARKGTLLYLVPALVSLGIPFTLILDPEIIGINRLRAQEEEKVRAEHGPFPFEKLDPLRFFSTWGKIVEIPKKNARVWNSDAGRCRSLQYHSARSAERRGDCG